MNQLRRWLQHSALYSYGFPLLLNQDAPASVRWDTGTRRHDVDVDLEPGVWRNGLAAKQVEFSFAVHWRSLVYLAWSHLSKLQHHACSVPIAWFLRLGDSVNSPVLVLHVHTRGAFKYVPWQLARQNEGNRQPKGCRCIIIEIDIAH